MNSIQASKSSQQYPTASLHRSGAKLSRRSKLQWIGIFCTLPIAALLFFAGWFALEESRAAGSLATEREALRMQGQPLDDESLAVWFTARTHKEGTEAWLEVLELSESLSRFTSDLPIIGTGFVPVDITPGMEWPGEPRVAELLEVFDPLLTKIHRACEFPTPVWWPIEWNGHYTLLPQYQQSRSVVRLLQLKAVHSLWKREPDDALKAIQSILRTASAFDSQALLVADLVVLAELGVAQETINRSLRMNVWDEKHLATLADLLKQFKDPIDSWNSILAGERAFVLSVDYDSISERDAPEILKYIPNLPSDRLAVLKHYQSMMDLSQGGMDGLLDRCAEWTKQFEQKIRENPWRASTLFLGFVTTNMEQIAQAKERFAIQFQLTRTAIAIKQFQVINGRFPKKLDELPSSDWPIANWSINNRTALIYEPGETDARLSYEGTASSMILLRAPKTPEFVIARENTLVILIR